MMKVVLYMAVTANGKIVGKNNAVDWVSKPSWNSYLEKVKEIGHAVIGRKTYDLMPPEEFVDGVNYYVLSSQTGIPKKTKKITFISSPKDLKNIPEICVCGGSQTNGVFMGLLDELYLDVEPKILGSGLSLFADVPKDLNLMLIGTKKLSENTIQLHYKVMK